MILYGFRLRPLRLVGRKGFSLPDANHLRGVPAGKRGISNRCRWELLLQVRM
jgi:hypothetical protein